jgi:hypothetical protein
VPQHFVVHACDYMSDEVEGSVAFVASVTAEKIDAG